ncbi:MAG: tRNA preQ1(34) S-adenosylmethionine ribosyltransferase-isomerase QueA [Mariniblastus sp.]|nr:tRNA preQ1(34) S-adenosylmethionine ribosyltransferase-isomerase QueA [Mariniblastus sp.]
MTEDGGSDLERIEHYDFELPKELIAQSPLSQREDARLLSVGRARKTLEHWHIRDLDRLLRPEDCLVLNDTKVIPAKLVGSRQQTGGRWQGLVIETDPNGNWRLLAKTRGRIKVGETVVLEDRQAKPRVNLVLQARLDDGSWVASIETNEHLGSSQEDQDRSAQQWLDIVGRVPLPHYIRGGNMVDADLNDYQTVFAKNAGAIAAPTAGLHFTKALFQRLVERGIKIASVTLHVGIGTFRPVTVSPLDQHTMHSEYGSLAQPAVDAIRETKEAGGRVIAVGTTSVRVLETAGRAGDLQPWQGETDLFIRPGFQFQVIDGLLTNFHLPRSTLVVLVRAFGGDILMKDAYQEAIEEKYRFFSYGDAMLIT